MQHRGEGEWSSDDLLSLWVGRVARAHANLEYKVHGVDRLLATRSGAAPRSSSIVGFDQLVTRCQRRLQKADVRQDIRDAGDAALDAAKRAGTRRNRIVHDMWLPSSGYHPEGGDWWSVFQRSESPHDGYSASGPRTVDEVVDAHRCSERACVRVSAIFMTLHTVWDLRGAGHADEELVPRYLAMMRDEFVLHPNGDVVTS